jgi:hypothetical protein
MSIVFQTDQSSRGYLGLCARMVATVDAIDNFNDISGATIVYRPWAIRPSEDHCRRRED